MSYDYLGNEEIAAHESAMQAVRDKRAAAEQVLRDEIERLHKELEERLVREVKVMHEKEEIEIESLIVEQERRIVLRRIYHEAPDDIMELIVKLFSDVDGDGDGKGGMNVFRRVSKRLMRVVESCATRLTQLDYNGPESLPIALMRCQRIKHIRCDSRKLKSLEGCPDGLKSLYICNGHSLQSLEPSSGCIQLESLEIGYAHHINDLNPLKACTKLKKLTVNYSTVSDISVLSSMPLLEEVSLYKNIIIGHRHQPSIKDLSPLIQCKMLKNLNIRGNSDIEDISPLTHCTQLVGLYMWDLTKLTDLKPLSSLTKLQSLSIVSVPVEDLTPLSALQYLEEILCPVIPRTTSILPLARCSKLKRLVCDVYAKDLDLLQERKPDVNFELEDEEEEEEEEE